MASLRRTLAGAAAFGLVAAIAITGTIRFAGAADTSDSNHVLFALIQMSVNWNQTVEPYTNGDTNGDGLVNTLDLPGLIETYAAMALGETTPTPAAPTSSPVDQTPTPPADTPTPSIDTPTPSLDTPTPEETPTQTQATSTPTLQETPTPDETATPTISIDSETATPDPSAPTATPDSVIPTPTQDATPAMTPTPEPTVPDGATSTPTPTLSGTPAPSATPGGAPTATPGGPTSTPLFPTPDPNQPTPEPVRLWEVNRFLELFLDPVIIPRIGFLGDSDLGYAAFGYDERGDYSFISFDRDGRIFTRRLPLSSDDSSGIAIADGGDSFGLFYESPEFTRRFQFEHFNLLQTMAPAVGVDHLSANDFNWGFAGSSQGWAMAVTRFPNIIRVHRIAADGSLAGTTEIEALNELPGSLPWVWAEFSGDKLMTAYPTDASGSPVHAWVLSATGEVLNDAPINIVTPLVEQAIAGDGLGNFYYLGSSSFGQRLVRFNETGVQYDRVLPTGFLADIECLDGRVYGIDRSDNSLVGFDEDGELREGPVNVFPPGWSQPLAWLDLRKSGPDLGAFFFNPDTADNLYYLQIEAGPLVTPTPTPAPGVPTGETVEIDLGAGINLEMVKIPRGSYIRGTGGGDPDARNTEQPAHTVTITKDFWIGKYEITNAQMRLFDPNHNTLGAGDIDINQDDMPVANVTWEKADAFCQWLSDQSEFTFSLPTEAEWEYVARAGATTRRPWGDDTDNDLTCSHANVADIASASGFNFPNQFPCDDGFIAAAPAGSFPANAYGVHDMLGNVWEWCDDWFAFYEEDAQVDPTGPERGRSKIIRGGSWQDGPAFVRSAVRSTFQPDDVYIALGFRVVIRE